MIYEEDKEQNQDTQADNGILNGENEEDYDSPEKLEQKKCETRAFYAEGNEAHNQFFIQDVGSGGFTINYYTPQMTLVTPKLPVEKRYDLSKPEECIEFVEAFKNSDFFTTAIILCVFEAVELADLPDLKAKLLPYLPEETVFNAEGQEVHVLKESPYTALNSVLAVIGGKTFITEDGRKCVSIGESSAQALDNVLEQFPVLQQAVTRFLMHLLQENKYHIMFPICRSMLLWKDYIMVTR